MLDAPPAWLIDALGQLPAVEIVTPVMVVAHQRSSGEAEPIHYAVRGDDGRGGTVYLRSHGADFNIMPRAWLRSGVRTAVSLGPGLDAHADERPVLLIQCFTSDDTLLRRFATETLPASSAFDIDHRSMYGRPCSLLSAVL